MTGSIDLVAIHAAFQRGEYAFVLDALLPAIDHHQTDETALALIANSALLDNRPSTAIPALERLVALRPEQAKYRRILSQACNRAGATARREKRLADAETFFRRSLDAWPDNTDALFNLALHCSNDSRTYDQALSLWRRLRELRPDDTETALEYANALALNQLVTEARAALEHLPNPHEPTPTLALRHAETLANADLPHQAIARLTDFRPEPVHATRLYALGEHLAQTGDIAAAEAAYRLAAEPFGRGLKSPGLRALIAAHLALPAVYRDSADIDAHRERYTRHLEALDAELTSQCIAECEPALEQLARSNFYLAYQGNNDRSLQARYGNLLSRIAPMLAPDIESTISKRPAARPRIGLVASIFRHCTAGCYFAGWARLLAESGYEVHIFQLGPVFDDITELTARSATRLHRVEPGLNALAATLAASECDLLIYPELGMEARLLPIAALRLAPRQACAWGHPVTIGLPTIDAYFSCADMEPADAAAHYNEPLLLLPGLGTDYILPEIPEPAARSDLGLPDGKRLYLLPHALFKLHPDNDTVLATIAAGDPDGVLILFQGEARGALAPFRRRLEATLREHGADPERQLLFLPMTTRERFLKINRACDVMVDSLHWSGGNTSIDALLCSLPVVTCPGRFMRARQSAAMLRRLGLDELIVDTPDALSGKAVAVARDSEWRHDLGRRIESNLPALFDTAGLAEVLRAHVDRLLDI